MPDLSELLERVIVWVEPLYRTYGYFVVALGALLEHTFFLAWALPGGVLVALGGLYAQSGVLSLPWVILTAMGGFVLGDHLDFFIGQRSKGILQRVSRGHTVDAGSLLTLRTLPALALAYTNAVPRTAIFMGGAASGLSYRRFLAISLSLACLWSSVYTVLGYWLGSNRQRLTGLLQTVGVGGQLILLLLVGGTLLYFYLRRKRRQQLSSGV